MLSSFLMSRGLHRKLYNHSAVFSLAVLEPYSVKKKTCPKSTIEDTVKWKCNKRKITVRPEYMQRGKSTENCH